MTYPFVSLGEVVASSTGMANPGKAPLDTFRYVDVAAVDNGQKRIVGTRDVLGSEAPSRARKLISTNDVLVSTVRPNLNAVAIVPAILQGAIASTGFSVLRATQAAMPEFIFYFVQSQRFIESLCKLTAGALYPAVTDRQVLEQRLPLPPLSEQRRIVDILSRAESIVRLRRDAQKKAAELIPALFTDLFGDPATNPKDWPMSTIGEEIESADYGSSTKASSEGAGLPLIRMGNVTISGDLNLGDLKYVELSPKETEQYRLRVGDIIFNRTNSKELVGKTGLWDGEIDAVVASYFIRLRVKSRSLNPHYLWAFMNSAHMKRLLFDTARGAIGQANINSKELKAFRIAVPPLDLQNKFESHCRDVSGIQSQQATATTQAETTFNALLAQVFSDS